MATVYNFKVSCVSAFVSYSDEFIAEIIKKSLENYINPKTGLKLECIYIEKDKK